jgi:hypothetical protein
MLIQMGITRSNNAWRIMKKKLKEKNQKQSERLSYIDFCANFLGTIGRIDIVKRFKISDAAASKDLAAYIDIAPNNLKYDFKTRTHRITRKFKPLFDFGVSQVLKALSTGTGDTLEQTPAPIIPSATAIELNQPEINILSQVSRAIHLKQYIMITYHSLSSGETERKMAPFAIINSGLRWHVRAFDLKSKEFRDFVFTRILSAKESGDDVEPEHSSKNDDKWNQKITLELVPHPNNIEEKRAVELDYKMIDGKKEIKVRKAIAGYILRHWNVDCTEDHRLDGKHFQLWLKNRNKIEGIDEIILAPGVNDFAEK